MTTHPPRDQQAISMRYLLSAVVLAFLVAPAHAASGKLLTEQQAHAKAVGILKGDPYGNSYTMVSSRIRGSKLIRSGDSNCGKVTKPVWIFDVFVPAEDNKSGGDKIEGYLEIDAVSGKMECAGLPFLN